MRVREGGDDGVRVRVRVRAKVRVSSGNERARIISFKKPPASIQQCRISTTDRANEWSLARALSHTHEAGH